MITKFEVGQPFPLHNHASGIETNRIEFNEGFLDIVYYIKNGSTEDIKTFRKGGLSYGVFESQNVAFLLIKYQGVNWAYDCSINIYALKKESDIENWLNSEANAITMYLIDADTNILLGMRMIGVQPKFAEEIRNILDEQLNLYKSKENVDTIIDRIVKNFTNDLMLQRTKMIKL